VAERGVEVFCPRARPRPSALALVAQWIEQRFPKPCVAGSTPAGGTRETTFASGTDGHRGHIGLSDRREDRRPSESSLEGRRAGWPIIRHAQEVTGNVALTCRIPMKRRKQPTTNPTQPISAARYPAREPQPRDLGISIKAILVLGAPSASYGTGGRAERRRENAEPPRICVAKTWPLRKNHAS
jgi:hypothetical protein